MLSKIVRFVLDPADITIASGIVTTTLAQVFGASTSLTVTVAAVFGAIVTAEKTLVPIFTKTPPTSPTK